MDVLVLPLLGVGVAVFTAYVWMTWLGKDDRALKVGDPRREKTDKHEPDGPRR